MTKKYIFILLIMFITKQDAMCSNKKFAMLSPEKKEIDLGKIKYKPNTSLLILLRYKNIGNSPLIIYAVYSHCGCIKTTWSKQPILPKSSDTIKIKYFLSERTGFLSRTLYVYSNSIENLTIIHIKGYIR